MLGWPRARGAGDGAAPRSVTLTERALCLPLLEVNAEANRATLGDARLAVREYSWGDRDGVVPGGPWHGRARGRPGLPVQLRRVRRARDDHRAHAARRRRGGRAVSRARAAQPDVERAFFEALARTASRARRRKADDIALYRGVLTGPGW